MVERSIDGTWVDGARPMVLTPQDVNDLTVFRRALHERPELSGEEIGTAATIAKALRDLSPDHLVTGLGGHGVAAVFRGQDSGPTVLFRCELDGLPIAEAPGPSWRSKVKGKAHLCGHDGHMAILMGFARLVARDRPARGRVIVLFQPAEEDGSGARAVVADPGFANLRPDWAFAIHNMPGLAFGRAAISDGPANCASQGLRVQFFGHTSHAATPDKAASPARAIAGLIGQAMAAGPGGALGPGFRLVTVTHARMGEPAFGITPGEGEVWLTLRCLNDSDMAALRGQVQDIARDLAAQDGLRVEFKDNDVFAACANDRDARKVFLGAMTALGMAYDASAPPMRASEDFGVFGSVARSAMVLLGAGEAHPPLHNPDYDFPDGLIPVGASLFDQMRRQLLG